LVVSGGTASGFGERPWSLGLCHFLLGMGEAGNWLRALLGSKVFMLGSEQPLDWHQDGRGLVIEIRQSVAENKPCQHAYVFKIRTGSI
jgi:hypothetical protein